MLRTGSDDLSSCIMGCITGRLSEVPSFAVSGLRTFLLHPAYNITYNHEHHFIAQHRLIETFNFQSLEIIGTYLPAILH